MWFTNVSAGVYVCLLCVHPGYMLFICPLLFRKISVLITCFNIFFLIIDPPKASTQSNTYKEQYVNESKNAAVESGAQFVDLYFTMMKENVSYDIL